MGKAISALSAQDACGFLSIAATVRWFKCFDRRCKKLGTERAEALQPRPSR